MPRPIRRRTLLLTVLAALAGAAGLALAWRAEPQPAKAAPMGLFTTLPILWNESAGVADLLQGEHAPHWALQVLRARGGVTPLDRLAGQPGFEPLAPLGRLLIAQPRPLAADENVALDRWVRGGGLLLLFADPMLTAHSDFALGDPRRPQDIVLLSPLLGRWGLRLEFDEAQPGTPREAKVLGQRVTVNLAGRLVAAGPDGSCRLESEGLVARCRIGRGQALIIADAALLDRGEGAEAAGDAVRARAFAALLDQAFAAPR